MQKLLRWAVIQIPLEVNALAAEFTFVCTDLFGSSQYSWLSPGDCNAIAETEI